MKIRRNLRPTAQADLVPMIDVIFQLVVFFLVSSTFVVAPGIAMELPGSSTTQSVSTEYISIYAYEDGRLFLGSDAVVLEDLSGKLLASGLPKDSPVSLLAEENTRYQRIVAILDELRRSGYTRVALRTEALP